MKKLYTTIIFAFVLINVNAQAPDWAWAKSAGSSGADHGLSTTIDASGNIYATGFFTSSSITFGTITLTSGGGSGNDFYVVKYDASGNVLWAKRAGGAGGDRGTGITTDATGNVYVTGYYGSLSTPSTIIFGTTILSTTGAGWDMFITKYDAAGNVLWARDAGIGSGNDEGHSISTDAAGNVYVGGVFSSDSITFGAITLVNVSGFDIFTVKYDSSGNVLWAKGAGSVGQDNLMSITTDASGNVYSTGYYSYTSPPVFPAITFGTISFFDTDTIHSHLFIVKYDAMGNVLWAKSILGAKGYAITTDASGNNMYVTGSFGAELTLGAFTLTNVSPVGTYTDIFLAKYDATGNVIWAKGDGSVNADLCYSITNDVSGNVYITGSYRAPSITFGTYTLVNADVTATRDEIFVVKYDASGNVQWAKGAGFAAFDHGNSIAADASGNVVVTGDFQMNFGPPNYTDMTFDSDTIINSGGIDMFIARLNAIPLGIIEEKVVEEIIVYPNPSNGIFKSNITIKKIEVFNLLGELVLTDNNTNLINLQAFPKGMYMIRINGNQLTKLIKE